VRIEAVLSLLNDKAEFLLPVTPSRQGRKNYEDGRGNSAPDATPFPYHRNGLGLQAHEIATPSARNGEVGRLPMILFS